MKKLIDQFLIYLAIERGLSTNYQISTRHSLNTFAKWLERRRIIRAGSGVNTSRTFSPRESDPDSPRPR